MARVRIAPLLHSYTGGQAELSAPGATLAELFAELDRRFPGLRFRIVDEQGQIRPHIWTFVAGRLTRNPGEPVAATDEVQIVGALSGG